MIPDPMQQPFYLATVYRNGKAFPIAVWNGIKGYSSEVPQELVLKMHGRIAIAQVSRPMGKGRSAVKTLEGLAPNFDGIILWARKTSVYRSIVDELKQAATHNLDGTPKTQH